ncbi:MAG: FHA domain-containing protein [Myxococcota bacterium]
MAHDLVAVGGPVAGERFPLPASEEIVIGRTQRGINLPDPLVSMKHASMKVERGQWLITDLDSATGTKVNGQSIPANTPTPVAIGDTILIGECEFQLDSGTSRVVRRLLWAMAPAWMLVFIAAGVLFWVTGDRPVTLNTSKTIHTTQGERHSLVIPKPFIRKHGLDLQQLSLRRITDLDEDQVDELWLHIGRDEFVVTFTDEGWKLLGRFPQGCVDRRNPSGPFPDLSCDGIDYRMFDGEYVVISQSDPVVWFVGEPKGEYELKVEEGKSKKGKKKAKSKTDEPEKGPMQRVPELDVLRGAQGPVPFRIAMGNADLLAGFLAAQGIVDPVHYILCEDGFPGVSPQALLQGGKVQRLAFGCGEDIKLEGTRAPAFEGSRVAAIAFTAIGREMLTKHLAYTWSGAPDPLFVPGFYRSVVDTAEHWPIQLKGGVYVGFESTGQVFHPIASEPNLSDRIRLEAEDATDREAITATLLSAGRATIDPAGCAVITIRTRGFRCAPIRGCLPGKRFLEVVESGCGEEKVVLSTGYRSGAFTGSTENSEVRVEQRTQSAMAVTDIIQARVGVRPKQ